MFPEPEPLDDDRHWVQALLGWLQNNYCKKEVSWGIRPIALLCRCVSWTAAIEAEYRHDATALSQLFTLAEARRHLQQSDESITTIAHACGFSESNHFPTQFRKVFSVAPKSVRQHTGSCGITQRQCE
ncbi:MAG: helix-turn-helix domain-containing protein [Symbiopectobacterium sp.]